MWFSKKKDPEESETRTTGRMVHSSDMRSTLGLGESSNAVQVQRTTRRVGATKAVTQDVVDKTYNDDVLLNDLKIRARRRLIGALILLAAAFVILPWVFDDDRKQTAPVVNVSIPEQRVQFEVQNPRTMADTSANSAGNLKPTQSAGLVDKPEAVVKIIPKVKNNVADNQVKANPVETADKPANKPVSPVKTKKFMVHIGLVSSKPELDTLNQRLLEKDVKVNTESVKVGNVTKTRVRLGPFDSQTAAQLTANKVKGAAKNPVVIEVK